MRLTYLGIGLAVLAIAACTNDTFTDGSSGSASGGNSGATTTSASGGSGQGGDGQGGSGASTTTSTTSGGGNEGGSTSSAGGSSGGDCNPNNPCPTGQFCDYLGNSCGEDDDDSMCKNKPESCGDTEDLVCGCDNVTYFNDCEAAKAGQDVRSHGPCPD